MLAAAQEAEAEAAGNGALGAAGVREAPKVAPRNKIQETKAQVDEVVGIMRDNVENVLARGEKLSELDDRAAALEQGASQFEQNAVKLRKKYWWKNKKMSIIMGVVGFLMVIIILGGFFI